MLACLRTQRITGSAFRISLEPHWPIEQWLFWQANRSACLHTDSTRGLVSSAARGIDVSSLEDVHYGPCCSLMPSSEILNPTKLVVPFVQTPLRCKNCLSYPSPNPIFCLGEERGRWSCISFMLMRYLTSTQHRSRLLLHYPALPSLHPVIISTF